MKIEWNKDGTEVTAIDRDGTWNSVMVEIWGGALPFAVTCALDDRTMQFADLHAAQAYAEVVATVEALYYWMCDRLLTP